MPQFDAAGIVEGLECKLKPFADFEGVIPEPTDRQIGDFLAGLKKTFAAARESLGGLAGDADLTDSEQLMAAVDALDPEKYVQFQEQMAGLHAGLCSGAPSAAQILQVPLRRRQLFYQWLQGEVMSPEAATPGGNGQVTILPRAAGA